MPLLRCRLNDVSFSQTNVDFELLYVLKYIVWILRLVLMAFRCCCSHCYYFDTEFNFTPAFHSILKQKFLNSNSINSVSYMYCTLPLPSIERFIEIIFMPTLRVPITEKWQRSILLCICLNEAIWCEWLLTTTHAHAHTFRIYFECLTRSRWVHGCSAKTPKNTHILMHTNTHKRRQMSEKKRI